MSRENVFNKIRIQLFIWVGEYILEDKRGRGHPKLKFMDSVFVDHAMLNTSIAWRRADIARPLKRSLAFQSSDIYVAGSIVICMMMMTVQKPSKQCS